ncbi:MAG: UDP-N-acetylmuramate dehydrogenase [Bacteroidota bacterium]|jgi:UDP-N-acetylmuramate dehydrogenase
MQLQENISLKHLNTFGIDVAAQYFSQFESVGQLKELLLFAAKEKLNHMALGGGSNVLFTKNVNGLVLKNELRGIEIIKEDEAFYYVKVAAGENWHQFVLHCINNNWAGLENLSLIPGSVGASPMQNIGAYGVEIEQVFYALEALHLNEGTIEKFSKKDCAFGYRESVFKRKYKGQFIILNVTYQLRKTPVLNTSYGAIEQELKKMGVKELSIKAISDAVIAIRSSKLPNPKVIGNAGSFFKNPEVSRATFEQLKSEFPTIVGYLLDNSNVKLAAGWLIEQCGWKGYRKGDAGCHDKQALVLLNYGHATGKEVYDLSTAILQSVVEKFGITLEREVNVM